MQVRPLTEFDFHPRLADSNGVSLVLFSAPGCGSCRVWLRFLSDFSDPLLQHCYVVDVQLATAVAREYEVFHLPSLFLFIDGKFHAQLQAEATPKQLSQAIGTLLNLPPQDEP